MAKPKKKNDSNEWLRPFMDLRENLRLHALTCPSLYHSVFLCGLDGTHDLRDLPYDTDADFEGKILEEIGPCTIGRGVWIRHYFFAESQEPYEILQTELRKLDEWLENCPDGVFPRLCRPRNVEPNIARLLTWMGILYHLAWKYPNEGLMVEMYYSESMDARDHRQWLPSLSEVCDPKPYITLMKEREGGSKLWKPGGATFPALVTASLRDVLWTSRSTIMLMKYYEIAPPVAVIPKRPEKQAEEKIGQPTKNQLDALERRDVRSLLKIVKVLVEHHGCVSGKINNTALKQKEIVEGVKKVGEELSQTTVVHVMRFIMFGDRNARGAMQKYRQLCADGKICDHLVRMKQTFDKAIDVDSKSTSGTQEGADGQGKKHAIEGSVSPRGEKQKTPAEEAMERESRDLQQAIIDGIVCHVEARHEEIGSDFTLKVRKRARDLAEGEVDLWIGEEFKRRKVRPGSAEEDDARDESLQSLKKDFLNDLGDRVFEAMREAKRR